MSDVDTSLELCHTAIAVLVTATIFKDVSHRSVSLKSPCDQSDGERWRKQDREQHALHGAINAVQLKNPHFHNQQRPEPTPNKGCLSCQPNYTTHRKGSLCRIAKRY